MYHGVHAKIDQGICNEERIASHVEDNRESWLDTHFEYCTVFGTLKIVIHVSLVYSCTGSSRCQSHRQNADSRYVEPLTFKTKTLKVRSV